MMRMRARAHGRDKGGRGPVEARSRGPRAQVGALAGLESPV